MFSLVHRLKAYAEDYKENVLLRETLLCAASEIEVLSVLGVVFVCIVIIGIVLPLFL